MWAPLYHYLEEQLGEREFETYAEYEAAVKLAINFAEEELGRIERWAYKLDNYKQLGATIKELEDNNED